MRSEWKAAYRLARMGKEHAPKGIRSWVFWNAQVAVEEATREFTGSLLPITLRLNKSDIDLEAEFCPESFWAEVMRTAGN